MRYFTYVEPDETNIDGIRYICKSEREIIQEYYPQWRSKIAKKHGYLMATFVFTEQDCIEDWCILHNTWC